MHRFNVYLSRKDNIRNLPLTACWWCSFEQQNFNFCTIWCSASDTVQDYFITSFQLPLFFCPIAGSKNLFFSLGAPAQWGTRWRSWLRHCSTSRKVSGLFPLESLEFFTDIIFPAAPWPWGPTHPPTKMSTSNISWG